MKDPIGDSNRDMPEGGMQDSPHDDFSNLESQRSLQHLDTWSKKSDKSRRLSKHASMGPDTENARRRTSKMGLFGLFNRSKISLDVDTPETQWEGIVSTERPVTRDAGGAAYIPPEADLIPIPEISDAAPDSKLKSQPSKGKLRNRQSFKWESKKEVKEPVPLPTPPSNWAAPPLFQVYPQSIKYSTLKAPLMSAEAILRLSKEASSASEGNAATSGERSGSVDGKPQKEKKLKKATALEIMAKSEWVDKTYVLVTAGYILQYAGQGTYDRVPEKILQLTDLSAAFATDAIPGKPFVLQISQALNEDGTIDTEMSRSMFKKMGGLRADMRRAVSNLLLVLENPEEMNEWLVAIRKEIEALGGKEHNPEMPWDEPQGKEATEQHMEQLPSPRYLVRRSPNQFSSPWSPPLDASSSDKFLPADKHSDPVRSPNPSLGNRQSMATQNSMNSRIVSDTHVSIDQVHLDRLRESFASTAERTNSTSRDSSPNRSPQIEQDFISEVRAKPLAKSSTHTETSRMSRQRIVESVRGDRESLQPTPTPSSRPNSNGVSPANLDQTQPRTLSPDSHRTTSPPPNFSVPTFSKRYSAASSSPAPSTTAQSPPPITVLQEASVSEDEELNLIAEEGPATVGQLQVSYKSSSRASMKISSPPSSTSHLNSPPTSSHSHATTPPGSSDGDRPYSRRFSSLDYARGISPVKPAQYSPAPHPPPNMPLPPVPNSASSSKRASLIPPSAPPPSGPLPPLPVSRSASEPSIVPPPTIPLPSVPSEHRVSSRGSTQSMPKHRSLTPSRPSGTPPLRSKSPSSRHSHGPQQGRAGPRPTTPSGQVLSSADTPQIHNKLDAPVTPRATPLSSQAHDISNTTPPLPLTGFVSTFTIEHQAAAQPSGPPLSPSSTPLLPITTALPPSSSEPKSPPKPTRAAPPPPPPVQIVSAAALLPQPSSTPAVHTIRQAPPSPRTLEAPALPQPIPSAPKSKPSTAPPVPEPILPTGPPSPPVVQPRKKLFRLNRDPTPSSSKSSKSKPATTPAPLITDNSPISPTNTKSNGQQRSFFSSPIEHPKSPTQQKSPTSPLSPGHPFIPPIKLSHSREKGSFDGPWNLEYDQGPHRTFLGLETA